MDFDFGTMNSAFRQGLIAYRAQRTRSDNPYARHSDDAALWEDGWCAASARDLAKESVR